MVHGVWRDAWYNVNYDTTKTSTMRENPAFQYTPQSQIILRDFDAPVNVAEKYIQRLTGYLQVIFFTITLNTGHQPTQQNRL